MKTIQIVVHDCWAEELYSKLSCLSSMIPIRQERRRDVIEISDGLICPVLIIGKYGSWNRLAGLRPDFWIAGDDDCRAMLTMRSAKMCIRDRAKKGSKGAKECCKKYGLDYEDDNSEDS